MKSSSLSKSTKIAIFPLLAMLTSCAGIREFASIGPLNGKEATLEENRKTSLTRVNTLRDGLMMGEKPSLCLADNWQSELEKITASVNSGPELNPVELANFADCLALSENLPQALFYYDMALANSGKNKIFQSKVYANMANMYLYTESPALAEQMLKTSLSLNSANHPARYKLALSLFAQGNYRDSLANLVRLQKIYPADENILYGVAANQLKLRRFNPLRSNILPQFVDKTQVYLLFSLLMDENKSGAEDGASLSSHEFNNGFLDDLNRKLQLRVKTNDDKEKT